MTSPRDALGRGELTTSLIFIFPLFLLYGVGVLFADTMSGVDFVTRLLFAAVDSDVSHYLAVYGGMAAVYVTILVVLRRRRHAALSAFFPLVLESAIYALTIGSLIVFVMQNLLGIGGALSVGGGENLGVWNALVVSSGAGVHEELVFRLGVMGGGAAVLIALGMSRGAALILAMVVSSLLFSAAHHVGPLGDPYVLDVFTYRFLAGTAFAVIFYFRSLAHAVYAHFLYDVYVLVLGSA